MPTTSKPKSRQRGPRSYAAAPTRLASAVAVLRAFEQLPDEALLDIPSARIVLGNISASTFWRGVASGAIPKPRRIGPQLRRMVVGELRAARRGGA